MKTKHSSRLHFSILFGIIALFLLLSLDGQAQNTKGDRPANNTRSIFRLPKIKGKKKGGDKAYTRDISGRRRIRTKNQSSAQRASQNYSRPYANRKPSGDRPSGRSNVAPIRSSTAKASRNNVYPNRGPFVHNPVKNPSRKEGIKFGDRPRQKIRSRTAQMARRNVYTNGSPFSQFPAPKPRNTQGVFTQRGGRFSNFLSRAIFQPFRGNGAPSASGNFITRGRRNVYWGKFSKGERPFTKDITGRPLRAKNYHTPFLGIIPVKDVYNGRKKQRGDRAVAGGRFPSSRKAERSWRGNVSGNSLRFRRPRNTQTVGSDKYSQNNSISGKGIFNRRLPSSGVKASKRSKQFSGPIQGRSPGLGASGFERFLGKFKGKKTPKGGGSVSSTRLNNNGQPIQVRGPKFGLDVGAYRGSMRRGAKAFSGAGLDFTGSIRARRPLKGGGSVSGRLFNNNGTPIQVRGPKFGLDIGAYRGNIRSGPKSFNNDGPGYSGNIKSRRPLVGGGSISGRSRNNGGRPVSVREPKFALDVGAYRGNIRSGPKSFNNDGPGYSGSIKARRPLVGGGSISNRSRNNGGRPVSVREPKFGFDVGAYRGNIRRGPKVFNDDGLDYTGNMKARRPLVGGGSISNRPRNNGGRPVAVREPKFGFDVGAYRGNLRQQPKSFSSDGYSYTGNIKAKKPLHGGGSISGKLWNNNNTPIKGRDPISTDKAGARYSGEIKLARFKKNYVTNPNAFKLALKKQRPDKSTFAVDGLQIRTKEIAHGRNPRNAKAAIDVHTPTRITVKASEYGGRMKLMWSHKHNPHSSKLAMDVRYPGKAIARLKDYQGNLKMSKPHGKGLHPDAQFAHSKNDNVKHERTILMNVKLTWAKLFRKNSNQTHAVKDKVRKPRYDKKEKELWKDLYD